MMALIGVTRINPQKNIAFFDYFIGNQVDLNLKAHPRQTDSYEGTTLHAILANENVKNATYILNTAVKERVKIDPTIRDIEGKTIVLIGVLLQDTNFVSVCLEGLGNAGINLADDVGRTPLHYAYLFGDQAMIALLKAHGASMACRDSKGRCPEDMLHEDQRIIFTAFRKFHIDADKRMVADGVTLLEQCISNREKIIATCDQGVRKGR